MSIFSLPLYFLFLLFILKKFPNLLWVPCVNFCFLRVNLCEMRLFKTMNHPHCEKWFLGFHSKQTVTVAEYTFNHTVFFVTQAASPPCGSSSGPRSSMASGPALGAAEEPLLLPSQPRRPGTAWSGAIARVWQAAADSVRGRVSVPSLAREPRVSPCQGQPGSLQTCACSFSSAAWQFYFFGFCRFQKIGK